jgi:hypothetical protein
MQVHDKKAKITRSAFPLHKPPHITQQLLKTHSANATTEKEKQTQKATNKVDGETN